MAQHLAGVLTTGAFCSAQIRGANSGSTKIEFIPKSHQITDRRIDIGTAGSIPLLLQSLIPSLIFRRKPITLEMVGGTAGLGAPTIEYMRFITFRILRLFGMAQPEINILRQGFYPRGGGLVKITFFPTKKLRPIRILQCGKVHLAGGTSVAGSLPEHVAERQAEAAKNVLSQSGLTGLKFSVENFPTHSRVHR
jgi:RNA 3'-phosphate cyclase